MSIELEPGTVIGGDFRVERELGVGGMGSVWVAEQLSTGKRRALKVMKRELVTDGRSRLRFIEEAKVGSRIDSAHVVEVIGAGVDDATGAPWLAMELLEGRDLDAYVQERGPRPLAEVAELFEQLAHALGEAHRQGVIHRDLKPENLFLADSRRVGGKPTLKVLDFGIATFVASDKTAATVTSAIGSPLWIAPEQTATGAKLRPATDVWAMGLIAFYLLTAKSYWPAANHEPFNMNALIAEIVAHPLVPASVRAGELGAGPLPPGFDEWFGRCVVREPTERFEDASEAAEALIALASGRSPQAYAPTLPASESPVAGRASTGPMTGQPEVSSASPGQGSTLPIDGGESSVPSAPASGPAGSSADPGSLPSNPAGLPPSAPGALPPQPVFAPTPAPTPPGGSGSGLLWLGFGGVAVVVGALVVGGGALWLASSKPDDADSPVREQPAVGLGGGYEAHLAACREAVAGDDPGAGIAPADEALALRPRDPDATECRELAVGLQREAEVFRHGAELLGRPPVGAAYRRMSQLPADSRYRERPEFAQAAREFVDSQIDTGRDVLHEEGDADEALDFAARALEVEPLSDSQRAAAERLAADARAARSGEGDAEAEPSGGDRGGGAARDAASECMMRGDNACVIRELEGGRARDARELSMLIEAYRARGQTRRAEVHMRDFVRRYPDHPRARMYRQILQR